MAAMIQHNYMYPSFVFGAKSPDSTISTSSETAESHHEFVSYTSFDNHDHKKTKGFLSLPESKTTHIVREKIDGSHFSIMWKNNKVEFCRRKGILDEDELFRGYDKYYTDHFDSDLLLNKSPRNVSLQDELIVCAKKLFQKYGTYLVPHGELFGNSWEKFKRPNEKDFPSFQTKVEYSPTLESIWYDIRDNRTGEYLPVAKANAILNDCGFMVSPILATYSTLEEALQHNEHFTSQISSLFLRNVHSTPNLAEGIIISPLEPYYYRSSRAIFKKKNKLFIEKARSNNKSPKRHSNPLDFLDDYCCGEAGSNRFNAVKSKLCDGVSKSVMANEYVCDVLSDLPPDSSYSTMNISEKKSVEKYIKKKIGHLIASM